MNVSEYRARKLELLEQAMEQYAEVSVFSHTKRGKTTSVEHRRRPRFLSVGVARGRGKSVRLAVRVAKGRGNVQRVKKLLKQTGLRDKDVQLVTRVDYRAQAQILRIADSGAHPKLCRGTFGAIVEDDEQIYILSCNHVLTNTQTAGPNDPIIQPSRCDTEKLLEVGNLDWWEPLQTGRADVALATIDASKVKRIDALQIIKDDSAINMDPRPIEDCDAVKTVFKYGARTTFSRGKVRAHDLDNVPVTYKQPDGTTFTVIYDNQIEIEPVSPPERFSQPGDSGALVFDDATNRPYGLLFSGAKGDDGVPTTLANFLPDVLKVAQVRLVTEEHPNPNKA